MTPNQQRRRLSERAGTIKRIHVDRHAIAANRRLIAGGVAIEYPLSPPITVQTSRGSLKMHALRIIGDSTMVYCPFDPLPCGATLWVETTAAIEEIH